MKIRALLMAVFVMAFGAVVAHAGATQSFGVSAGLSMPTGDAADFLGTGFLVGGTYCYKVDPQFGVGADLNYHMFGEKTLGGDKFKWNLLQYDVNGKYFFPMKDAKMAPYIKAGLGMYSISAKNTTVIDDVSYSATVSSSKFGFNAGLGSTWAVNDKASFGAELLYHMISTEGESTNLFTAAVSYNFMLGK